MDNRLINNLAAILYKIDDVYTKLLEILVEEKKFVMENSLSDVMQCVKRKETLSLKLKILEESRKEIVNEIAGHYGISQSNVTLTYLINNLGSDHSEEILTIKNRLTALITKIQIKSRENKNFIRHSMENIKTTFNFIKDIASQNKTYGENGNITEDEGSGVMLCQQV